MSSVNSTFSIQYGSGAASGILGQDAVTLGGYTVAQQIFASCSSVDSGLIPSTVSGIMGLSWLALSYSHATPWWITLATSNVWSSPVFSFYLNRYRDIAGATTSETNGGQVTFGYVDSSMYSGSITYVPVTSNPQYWQIPMDSMSIQGSSISLGGSTLVAIDTGTTLIGGPASIIAAIYAQIPGSSQMTGTYSSYYQYPCSTSINFSITFGGYNIAITDQDFNLGRYTSDQTMCTGAAFVESLPASSPVQWIIGDTALKNVYSVYRYSPAAVGFAALPGAASTYVATTIPTGASLTSAGPMTGSVSSAGSANVTSTSAYNASSTGHSSSTSTSKSASSSGPVVVTATAIVTATQAAATAAAATAGKSSAGRSAGVSAGLLGVGALLAIMAM